MNRGGDFYFAHIGMLFFWMGVIGVVLGFGAFVFYSQEIDVRAVEAEIMRDKLVDAFVDGDKLKAGIVCEEQYCEDFSLYEAAGINAGVIEQGNFYFEVRLFHNDKLIGSPLLGGDSAYAVECSLSGKNFPVCVSQTRVVSNYRLEVLAGSNQRGAS